MDMAGSMSRRRIARRPIRYRRGVEYLDDRDLNIYTDGSSYSGPRRGGVGILFVTVDDEGNEQTEAYPLPGMTAPRTIRQS
jgi:hypothetical protein